jgi:hypothetical protein
VYQVPRGRCIHTPSAAYLTMPSSTLPKFVIVQAKIQTVAALGLGTHFLHNTLGPVLCSCPLAGLALLTIPDVVHSNSIADRLSLFLHPIGTAPTSSPAIHQLSALSGVFSCAISSAYGLAFYHDYDEWLYMSIPGRLFVSAICLATWLIAPEKMSPLLLSIMIWDGACAVIGGYLIGDFSGRKPGRLEQGKDK